MGMDLNNRASRNTSSYSKNTQGTSFEKACINLAKKETVYGEL